MAAFAVFVSAGDQRSYVSYGRTAANEPAARQTLASFNGEGRPSSGAPCGARTASLKPFATIVRFSVTKSADDPPVKGAVLVVTRLGTPVCRVGYVDALRQSRCQALAQKIADDHARTFQVPGSTNRFFWERRVRASAGRTTSSAYACQA